MGEYRKFIFVCTGTDCKGSGCKKLIGEIKDLTGSGPLKGQFKIIKTKCMDFCKNSPVVIYREEVIKKATLEKVEGVLSEIERGRKTEDR
jgi:NADH:ubiquinone oxidoreductase subunit E